MPDIEEEKDINFQQQQIKVDIQDPQFFEFMNDVFFNMKKYNNIPEAKEVSEELARIFAEHRDLASNNSELYQKWQILMLKFKLIALPLLGPDEVRELLNKHLFLGFQMNDFDMKRALDGVLLSFASDEEMFDFYAQMQKDLESNQSILLGEQELQTELGKKKPAIGNWIEEYRRINRGKTGERGGFEQITFVTNNANAQRLSEKDRELLKKLLDFYDWIVFPKDPAAVFEDPKVEKVFDYVADHAGEIVKSVIDEEVKSGRRKPEEAEREKKRIDEIFGKGSGGQQPVKGEETTELEVSSREEKQERPVPVPPKPKNIPTATGRSSLDELKKTREEFEQPEQEEPGTGDRGRAKITPPPQPPAAPPRRPEAPPQQTPPPAPAEQSEAAQKEQDEFAKKLEALTSKPLSGEGRGSIGGIKQPSRRPETPKENKFPTGQAVDRRQERVAPAAPFKPKQAVSEDKAGESEIQKLMEQQPKPQESKSDPFSVNEAIARVGQKTPGLGEIVSPSDEQSDAGQVENKKQEGEKQDNSQDQGRITPGL